MEKKKVSPLYRLIKGTVGLIYPDMRIEGAEQIPEKHAVIVANHAQMNGPIAAELYLPDNCYIWCAGEMMHLKEVPRYAFTDFWSQKPTWIKPFFRALSYVIAPLSVCVFGNARTVAVYHDMRIKSTFRDTVRLLDEGANMVIFPEKNETDNNIVYKFQDRFVDTAKMYYRKTKIALTFVPMYICPELRKMCVGEPVTYENERDIALERERIANYLSGEITKMARELPEHTVVPYSNIPKKRYLTNKDVTKVPI